MPRVEKELGSGTGSQQMAVRSTVWALAVLTVSVVAAVDAVARGERPFAEFDLSLDEEHAAYPIIPVVLNGTKYRFLVDTGSTLTSLDVRHRGLLGPPKGALDVQAVGGNVAESIHPAPQGFLAGVALPSFDSVMCTDVAARCGPAHGVVDGVLGARALRDCIIRLDFDRAKIEFLRAVPRNAGVRVELARGETVPTMSCILHGYGARPFILDTGFTGEAALAHTDFSTLLSRGSLKPCGAVSYQSAGRQFMIRMGVLSSGFVGGGYTHRSIVIHEIPDKDGAVNALGLDHLSRFTITLDFPGNAIYLKPSATFRALRPAAKLLGVRLSHVRADTVATSVRNGSHAAGYGIRAGDVLDSVNGMPVASMTDAELIRILMMPDERVILNFHRPSDDSKWWLKINDRERSSAPLHTERRVVKRVR